MRNKYLPRRLALLISGLFIMAYGVSFSIKAGLGTSPISSLPYTLSELTPLTVGTATIAMHCFLIILQIQLLRKQYRPLQLLQLPVALVFGCLTDATLYTIHSLAPSNYIQQWLFCLAGILLVGFGVACEIKANIIPLAGEGFVLAVCQKSAFSFPPTKICFDCSLVLLSCILGFVFRGSLLGVREGTIVAALSVGWVSRQVLKYVLVFQTKKVSGASDI